MSMRVMGVRKEDLIEVDDIVGVATYIQTASDPELTLLSNSIQCFFLYMNWATEICDRFKTRYYTHSTVNFSPSSNSTTRVEE